MDISSPIFKLEAVTFLDSICYGLLYGFLSPYLLSHGANQTVIGVLAAGNLIGNLISADLISNLTQIHGKRYSLFLMMNIAMASHLFLVLSSSYWCTIVARYVFSITNQSQNLCKDLLLQNTPKDEHGYYLAKYNILNASGYIIGPIIAGCLFSFGFFYVAILAAVLTFINTCIILALPFQYDDKQPNERRFICKSRERAEDVLHSFTASDYRNNWDIIAIKFLYMSSITIFYSKFPIILNHNFNATPFSIGCTGSYMNSLTFVGKYFASNIKDHYSKYSVVVLTESALVVSGIALLLACYSPVYNLYATVCIPMIFATSLMDSIWQDLFKSRGNSALVETNFSIGILAGLTMPVIFGMVCDVIGHHAVIIFSVVPILGSLFVINKYTLQHEEKENKNK